MRCWKDFGSRSGEGRIFVEPLNDFHSPVCNSIVSEGNVVRLGGDLAGFEQLVQ
ncbi:MAG: hypothetical protein ABIH23_03535 [bacterium]